MIWVLVRTWVGPPTRPGRGPLTEGPELDVSSSSLRRKAGVGKKGSPRSRRCLRQKKAAPARRPRKAGSLLARFGTRGLARRRTQNSQDYPRDLARLEAAL